MTSYNPGPNLGGPDLSGRDNFVERDIRSERPGDARRVEPVADESVYTPVYARKEKGSNTSKIMLFAAPIALVATGALVWATSGPKTTETTVPAAETAAARPMTTPAPVAPTPTEMASMEAPVEVAPPAEPAAAPAARRTTQARASTPRVRAASTAPSAPSASTATSDVSATVPPPIVAIPEVSTPAPSPAPQPLVVDPMNAAPPVNATPPIVDPDPR
ncbi:hypothetical protein [Caulobacter sp. NIBR2454]|uniref:hypothetical protein n=1 Tax=Caulobacter sp. NIBR2454 TaxID=3015996 RepID=UPI0022B5FA03|nr:hypothetical protein [Caulobacter sp. NIBR2454]